MRRTLFQLKTKMLGFDHPCSFCTFLYKVFYHCKGDELPHFEWYMYILLHIYLHQTSDKIYRCKSKLSDHLLNVASE